MWTQIAVAIIMMIVSSVLQAAMAPKPKPPEPGNLDIPKAEEGGCIPVVFGTVLIKSSNVIWYGDSSTQPIKGKGGKK